MTHPSQLLPAHTQLRDSSCIAWSLELILKMRGKIAVDAYPLQCGSNPDGYGYGATERQLLKGYDIDSREHPLDWQGFAHLAYQEVQRGSYPVFSLPLVRRVDFDRMAVGTGYHAFVVSEDSGQLIALTMKPKPPGLVRIDRVEMLFRLCRELEPDCRVHVLTHG